MKRLTDLFTRFGGPNDLADTTVSDIPQAEQYAYWAARGGQPADAEVARVQLYRDWVAVQRAWIAQAVGYRVEYGGPGDLAGKWWWALMRPGWIACEVSLREFPSQEAAWADAYRDNQAAEFAAN